MLEHHADLPGPHGPQFGLAKTHDILAIHMHGAGGWFDQAIDMADNGGLTGTRQPHDAEDFALCHRKTGIGNANRTSETLERLVFSDPLGAGCLKRLPGTGTEYLPEISALYRIFSLCWNVHMLLTESSSSKKDN